MRQYTSPTGVKIIATLEVIEGVALISGFEPDGTPIYSGMTDLDWNSQVTVKDKSDNPSIILVDENDNRWPMSVCSWLEDGEAREP